MVKLLRAKFQNFRLLRELKLEFSSDANRKLTVIRAANESGKTTILHALQWALYGDDALPGGGKDFRLHPIDWNLGKSKRVPITASVEFERTTYRRGSRGLRESRQRYRLVRSVSEYVDSQSRQPDATIKLFELNEAGASPINMPQSLINEIFPLKLREVFFTDGDRALSFIEADVTRSDKRERVEHAIRSLLNLDIIEDAIRHVRRSKSEVDKKVKKINTGSELNRVASRLVDIETDREKFEAKLEDAKQQFESYDERFNNIDRKIAETLQKGDKEKLQKDRDHIRNNIKQLDSQLKMVKKEHSALFSGRAIATDLLAPLLGQAFEKLEELHDQGKIPSTTIPVLHERLSTEICICNETLAPSDPDGARRREHIQKLIYESQRADEIQEIITDLYYGAKPMLRDEHVMKSTWLEDYKKVVERRDSFQDMLNEAGREFSMLEQELDALPDTDLQGLRKTRRQYQLKRDEYLSEQSIIKTQLDSLRKDRDELEIKRDRMLREQKKFSRILAESEITNDVEKILQSVYERIINEELQKVSDLMNSIFIEMIGADPEQGAIIQRAEISQQFDIIVYGPDNRTLNPDQDLNGASRRALTFAFILALTKVSEVLAPNVIDTPLGMTSGYVRRSILKMAVRESAQLVLFLTHDEIAGCEDIIDEAAGVIFTLTNPAHYPKMLVNDPGIEGSTILRCECDHRSECQLCLRRNDLHSN